MIFWSENGVIFSNMIVIKTYFNPFSAGIDFRCFQNLQNLTSMDTKELTNKTFMMMISNRKKLLFAMIIKYNNILAL